MFMTYLWYSIIFLLYSWGSFCTIVVLVHIHRPFLLINHSHHEVVPAKSIIDISMASLFTSIKIIFVETALLFFLWSIIQFLIYSSSFGHLGAHEHKVFLLLSALINLYCTTHQLGCVHLNSHGTKAPLWVCCNHLNAQYSHVEA